MSPSPTGSRGGGVVILQVLLAMLFLAIIGGTVGYLLGKQHNSGRPQASGSGRSTATTGPSVGVSGGTGAGSPTPGTGIRCPSHTEAQAGTQLTQVLHLHTTVGTDVWICQSADGTLYYQGRRAGSSTFQEKVNALFLPNISASGGEYVAQNYNPADGSTTEYHVTAQRLVTVFLNYASPRPAATELAAP